MTRTEAGLATPGTGAGFDGVDLVTVVVGDGERALRLYRDVLGFRTQSAGDVVDPREWRSFLELEPGDDPLHATVLDKPGAAGGALRVVVDPLLADVDVAPVRFGDVGPMALDFYVRDLASLHAELVADGWTFRSPPVRYALFGTGFEVTEVLMNGPQGLTHSFVEYLDGRHRCALNDDADLRVSEVIAVVHLVEDMDEVLSALTAFGGSVYLDETFAGPEVERMMALAPGTTFRLAMARGPRSRNARIELISPAPGGDGGSAPRSGPSPRVVLGCGLPPEAVAPNPGSLREATLDGPGAAPSSRFWSPPWGARFELFERSFKCPT